MTDNTNSAVETAAEADENVQMYGGAAAFADAETREILNLLGESGEGGACCGGSCCSA